LTVDLVPTVVERPVGDRDGNKTPSDLPTDQVGDLCHTVFVFCSDVVDLPDHPLHQDQVEGLNDVVDEDEGPFGRSVPLDRQGFILEGLAAEPTDDLVGVLTRAINVVGSGDDDRQLVRGDVRLDEGFRGDLTG